MERSCSEHSEKKRQGDLFDRRLTLPEKYGSERAWRYNLRVAPNGKIHTIQPLSSLPVGMNLWAQVIDNRSCPELPKAASVNMTTLAESIHDDPYN